MPLIKGKSKQAFSKNVATEMDAGKPQKQSLAIAFSTQRHAKKKKMAYGGMAENDMEPAVPMRKSDNKAILKENYDNDKWAAGPDLEMEDDEEKAPAKKEYMAGHFAMGGEVNPSLTESKKDLHPSDLMEDEERAESIAEAIMQKRRKFADGGMVDMEENSEEHGNGYDGLNAMAEDTEQYDDSQISAQPEDSNEMGDMEEDDSENKHDMVSAIRRKLRMKSGA